MTFVIDQKYSIVIFHIDNCAAHKDADGFLIIFILSIIHSSNILNFIFINDRCKTVNFNEGALAA